MSKKSEEQTNVPKTWARKTEDSMTSAQMISNEKIEGLRTNMDQMSGQMI